MSYLFSLGSRFCLAAKSNYTRLGEGGGRGRGGGEEGTEMRKSVLCDLKLSIKGI